MQIEKMQTYSFPMKPNVFYGVREMKFKTGLLERPLTFIFEIISRETKNPVEISKRTKEIPSFLIKSQRGSGIYQTLVKSVERLIRNEIFSAPAGIQIFGGKKEIADISAMFLAVPLMEGDIVARIPVLFANEVYFSTEIGKERTKKAIFVMKPHNFGYLVIEMEEFERMLKTLENRLKAAFEG